MLNVSAPSCVGKVRPEVSQKFNNFPCPVFDSVYTQDAAGRTGGGSPEDWGGDDGGRAESVGRAGEADGLALATHAGGGGGGSVPGLPRGLGGDGPEDERGGGDDDDAPRADSRDDLTPVPDISLAHARVTAAIASYWAAVDAFRAIPKSTWTLDSAGDAAAGLAIDRVHQGKRRATARLIASIREYSDAMDADETTHGRDGGAAEPCPFAWPVFPDERDGRLYFVGDGPGGARGDDGVAVVRLTGWACEAVGRMAGKGGR